MSGCPTSHPPRAGPVLALVVALGVITPTTSFAATVVLIKSGPLSPYEEAATAFKTAAFNHSAIPPPGFGSRT